MRRRLKKVWEFLKILGEVLADMPQAEMRASLAKKTCPNCGHVRQNLPTGCGPF
jgi:hypothetical protein